MQYSKTVLALGPETTTPGAETTANAPTLAKSSNSDSPKLSPPRHTTRIDGRNVHFSAGHVGHTLNVALLMAGALFGFTIGVPVATAAPCPDIEVVFARGTTEPAGVGEVGQAFVDSLRAQTGGQSLEVYPVHYPASADYSNSSAAGAHDAAGHVKSTVAKCPNTKIVLGGYSQGAVVIDRITTQLPPHVADHVAALAVFANPSSGIARKLGGGGPLPTIGPLYLSKTIDQCVPNDLICSDGRSLSAHEAHEYVQNGMTNNAAAFAASRLAPAQ